jgi:aconitase A
MTNIGHFRAAGKLLDQVKGQLPTRLWLSPPTKMDAHQLTEEGYYGIYGKAGARMEMPGCSLCMGNQARVEPNSTVVSTSTRNFPNRLGDGANVYLASAELASVASILGRLPTVEEYMEYAGKIDSMAAMFTATCPSTRSPSSVKRLRTPTSRSFKPKGVLMKTPHREIRGVFMPGNCSAAPVSPHCRHSNH